MCSQADLLAVATYMLLVHAVLADRVSVQHASLVGRPDWRLLHGAVCRQAQRLPQYSTQKSLVNKLQGVTACHALIICTVQHARLPWSGDLNDAAGVKDLGIFSGVPEAAGSGKLAASALANTSVPSAANRVCVANLCSRQAKRHEA